MVCRGMEDWEMESDLMGMEMGIREWSSGRICTAQITELATIESPVCFQSWAVWQCHAASNRNSTGQQDAAQRGASGSGAASEPAGANSSTGAGAHAESLHRALADSPVTGAHEFLVCKICSTSLFMEDNYIRPECPRCGQISAGWSRWVAQPGSKIVPRDEYDKRAS